MKKLFSDIMKMTKGKKLAKLIIMMSFGILLMVIGNYYTVGTQEKLEPLLQPVETNDIQTNTDDVKALEKRLTEVLSSVEGVGAVKVMITQKSGPSLELATDTVYEKSESVDEQQSKTEQNERRETKHILVAGKNGTNEPVTIKQSQPEIEGVIIVAQGGNNSNIKARLTKAAGAVLNLPAHKIEVLKMKEE